MRRLYLHFMICMCIPFFLTAQTDTTALTKKEIRKNRPAYITISSGMGFSKFRDFATSPLFYDGNPLYFEIGRLSYNTHHESDLMLSYLFGNYKAKVGDHVSSSRLKTVFAGYMKLYALKNLNNQQWNIKVGGNINATANYRINNSLQNNALGLELFATLFGTGKIEKDISRKESKDFEFLFIKKQLHPRQRKVLLRLDAGLVNTTFRNGYVYSGQSAVINNPEAFDDYQFKVFSGLRLKSQIGYLHYLRNKNALSLSYNWDVYKTGGELDVFEMAHHIVKFTLWFNTK